MPYWNVVCLYCQGLIIDALLECVPAARQAVAAYRSLFLAQPGAAFACPYCNGLIGFDQNGQPQSPASGWPVFRYGRDELERKKQADGEPANVTLAEWLRKHRLTQPGTHEPLTEYTYAEDAAADELVP